LNILTEATSTSVSSCERPLGTVEISRPHETRCTVLRKSKASSRAVPTHPSTAGNTKYCVILPPYASTCRHHTTHGEVLVVSRHRAEMLKTRKTSPKKY